MPIQERITRILTLVCFFNFFGLNNGFAALVLTGGKIQRIDFTSAMIEKSIVILNPTHWDKTIFDSIRSKIFHKPVRMISYASQRAVQNMLIESSILRSWLMNSLLDEPPPSDPSLSQKARISVSQGQKNMDLKYSAERRFTADLSAKNLIEQSEKQSQLAEDSRYYGMRDPPGYLNLYTKKPWKKDRFHTLPPSYLNSGITKHNVHEPTQSAIIASVKRFIKITSKKIRLTIFYGSEKSEDDLNTPQKKNSDFDLSRFAKSGIFIVTPPMRDWRANPAWEAEHLGGAKSTLSSFRARPLRIGKG